MSFMEFLLPDGWTVSVDESDGPKRMPVEWPRPGEWWELRECPEHDPDPSIGLRSFRWKDQVPRREITARMKCACLIPTFEPGALKGPTGAQG